MTAIYDCETRKQSWWEPMPTGFNAKVNGCDWERQQGLSIANSNRYYIELKSGKSEVKATAEIKFDHEKNICLFIGRLREARHGRRAGDFIVGYGNPPNCDDGQYVSSLWSPRPDWMKDIDDNKKLSEFNIPGTHDTCALAPGNQGWPVKCQTLDLRAQLYAGVRFLDIRCRHIEDVFAIHHGAFYQDINFGKGVRNVCIEFLKEHPEETIIMSIKEEYNATDNTRSFQDTLKWYMEGNRDYWYLGGTTPKLKDVRGKIVIIRRYGNGNLGISASPSLWKDNETFTINDDHPSKKLRVQDCYFVWYTQPGMDGKWDKICSLLNEAERGDPNVWFLNFTSGSSRTNPCDVANGGGLKYGGMNTRLQKYLENNAKARYGTIIMDFVEYDGHKLIPLIVDNN